jgi:hypothetical protein
MLSLVQRVFWNPLVHEENRALRDIRPSEFVAASVLVALMIWIGVRPNDVLSRLTPTVEALRASVANRTAISVRNGLGDGGTGGLGDKAGSLHPVTQSPRPPVASPGAGGAR